MIPRRALGKTGYEVSIFSLGGESILEQTGHAEEAEKIINRAIDLGVNYIDTAPTYGAGGSEKNIGRVMAYRRNKVFLATKTGDRSYDGTMRKLERSLKKLRTDYLDLYQLHDMQNEDDLKRAFSNDGALKALEKLREQKVVRFIGITGHKDPDLLLKGIKEYPFDCLLIPINAGDIHDIPFQNKLLPEAVEMGMGVIAMKVTAVKRIFHSGGITSMKQALSYTLTFPVSTAIVGISKIEEVDENARITAEFNNLSEDEIKQIESMTKPYSYEANFFKHEW
ncbi:MAG: aldo/keto reductase [Bacillota bacterium]|nr:aldo/keto reductase [Bacillota bacterium]